MKPATSVNCDFFLHSLTLRSCLISTRFMKRMSLSDVWCSWVFLLILSSAHAKLLLQLYVEILSLIIGRVPDVCDSHILLAQEKQVKLVGSAI